MSDYEIEDIPCPNCGAIDTRSAKCWNGCDGGRFDLYQDSPIEYGPGESERCDVCFGTGILRWCPKCGADIVVSEME